MPVVENQSFHLWWWEWGRMLWFANQVSAIVSAGDDWIGCWDLPFICVLSCGYNAQRNTINTYQEQQISAAQIVAGDSWIDVSPHCSQLLDTRQMCWWVGMRANELIILACDAAMLTSKTWVEVSDSVDHRNHAPAKWRDETCKGCMIHPDMPFKGIHLKRRLIESTHICSIEYAQCCSNGSAQAFGFAWWGHVFDRG